MQEDLKFVELKAGGKGAKRSYDINSPTMDQYEDAGLLLNNNVVLVDFDGDNGEKEKWILEYIKSKYPTLTITTTKGYHFYFSKPSNLIVKNNADVITVGGFQVDYKTGNQYGIVKRNGIERKRNMDLTLTGLPELPDILYPIALADLKPNLSNKTEGSRNTSIFKHLCAVRGKYPELSIEKIGKYINYNIFKDPLPDAELHNIINSVMSRDINTKASNQPLEVISALELRNTELKPIKFIVEDMLPQGLNIICSPPKYGKSWLMLDLCLSVASGNDFLKHKTRQCNCLYLALEDSKNRLKDRMLKILHGVPPSPNFDFAIKSGSIGTNLIDQLNKYITDKPNTELIVIDTLQKVRGYSSTSINAYENDYKELGKLKNLADEKEICILLVHHLRKMGDAGDPFTRISGSNGIMGTCDTTFVLAREKRSDNQTILSMTGRDIEENEYVMEFDKTTFKWKFIGDYESQVQLKKWEEYEADPIIKTIKVLLEDNDSYEGTASELFNKCVELFGEKPSTTPAVLSKKLKAIAPLLNIHDGIKYEAPPENGKGGKRLHKFIGSIDFSKNDGTTDTTDY